jgi:hypothetical protein
MNENTNSYTNVGMAHAKFLLVTYLKRKTPGDKNLLMQVHPL